MFRLHNYNNQTLKQYWKPNQVIQIALSRLICFYKDYPHARSELIRQFIQLVASVGLILTSGPILLDDNKDINGLFLNFFIISTFQLVNSIGRLIYSGFLNYVQQRISE